MTDPNPPNPPLNKVIGMDENGVPDLAKLEENGLRDIKPGTAEYRTLIRAINKANSFWFEKTKRYYGWNNVKRRPFHKRKSSQEFELPAFQNRDTANIVVERKVGKTYTEIPRESYEPDKISEIRGDLDTLTHESSWQPGRYQITAYWGELDPPANVEEDMFLLIGFFNTFMSSPLGLGTQYEMHGDIPIEKIMPRNLWLAIMSDKVPSFKYIRRR